MSRGYRCQSKTRRPWMPLLDGLQPLLRSVASNKCCQTIGPSTGIRASSLSRPSTSNFSSSKLTPKHSVHVRRRHSKIKSPQDIEHSAVKLYGEPQSPFRATIFLVRQPCLLEGTGDWSQSTNNSSMGSRISMNKRYQIPTFPQLGLKE